MTAIVNIITGFFDVIKSVVDFVITFFSDVVYIVKTLGQFIIKAPLLFGFLPPAVLGIFLVGLSVVIIYKVVGRD